MADQYPPCVGMPGRQQAVHYKHCPDCLRSWALRHGYICPICGGKLLEGEVPKLKLSKTALRKTEELFNAKLCSKK